MAGKSRYEWPPIEGLIALSKKHGIGEAAMRLGLPESTLRSHFRNHGVRAEEYLRETEPLAADGLKELYDLINS